VKKTGGEEAYWGGEEGGASGVEGGATAVDDDNSYNSSESWRGAGSTSNEQHRQAAETEKEERYAELKQMPTKVVWPPVQDEAVDEVETLGDAVDEAHNKSLETIDNSQDSMGESMLTSLQQHTTTTRGASFSSSDSSTSSSSSSSSDDDDDGKEKENRSTAPPPINTNLTPAELVLESPPSSPPPSFPPTALPITLPSASPPSSPPMTLTTAFNNEAETKSPSVGTVVAQFPAGWSPQAKSPPRRKANHGRSSLSKQHDSPSTSQESKQVLRAFVVVDVVVFVVDVLDSPFLNFCALSFPVVSRGGLHPPAAVVASPLLCGPVTSCNLSSNGKQKETEGMPPSPTWDKKTHWCTTQC